MADSWIVVRRPAAIDDIEAIWRYFLEIDEALADRFVDTIDGAIASLAQFPERGAARDRIHPGLRGLLISPWLILYRVNRATAAVEVVRVIDGRRDLSGIMA